MAEPVGLFAQIKITENNYKAFLKTKALALISVEIYECIHSNDKDYYYFKYDKKKE